MEKDENLDDILISPREFAKLLKVSEQFVRTLRHKKEGPTPIKISSSYRYYMKDVREYINKRRMHND